MSLVRRDIGRVKLRWEAEHDVEHAMCDRGWNRSGKTLEPLGSVSVYLCGLLAVIFMWDTSLIHDPAERP
jgi:hypothetical protein